MPPRTETYSGTRDKLTHSVTTTPGDIGVASKGNWPDHAPMYTALGHGASESLQDESRKLLCRMATLQKNNQKFFERNFKAAYLNRPFSKVDNFDEGNVTLHSSTTLFTKLNWLPLV